MYYYYIKVTKEERQKRERQREHARSSPELEATVNTYVITLKRQNEW